MALVVLCTLAQVRMGTFRAVDMYVRSMFVYWTPQGASWRVPVFPGGGLVGLFLLLNLVAAQGSRLEWSWRKAGLWTVHLGLILLFVGEFVTGLFQVETQLQVEEGQARNFIESVRETELALIDGTDSSKDRVYSIPERVLARQGAVEHPELPFTLLVKRFFANSELSRHNPGEQGMASMATQGLGPGLVALERPPVSRDDEGNVVTAFVEIVDGDRSLGTWLVSSGLGAEQPFAYEGRSFRLALRRSRRYLPFSLALKDFRHEKHPGTDIPRRFSSLVRLQDPARGQDREVLISMNQPLRYGGRTFYQASFGKDDTLSILQVVENPGWLIPYLAAALVGTGLLWHFLMRLRPALKEAR